MKKHDLKKLALMGLTGGLLVGQQGSAEAATNSNSFQGKTLEVLAKSCKTCSALSQRGCSSCKSIAQGCSSCKSLAQSGCSSCKSLTADRKPTVPAQSGCSSCKSLTADRKPTVPAQSGCSSCKSLTADRKPTVPAQSGCSSCKSLTADRKPTVPAQSGCSSCKSLTADRNPNGCSGRGGCRGIVADNDEVQSTEMLESPEAISNPNDGNMHYHLMTEQELLLELNPEGVKMYKSLDDQGKALALRVSSMMCQGTNECKGLNGCQTAKNSCAGKGTCKGQGKCAISDKNLAVKLVYNKMDAKRAKMAE